MWNQFRGDTGRVAKTNETDPYYINWYPDPENRKTFPNKPASTAIAEGRPDPVLTNEDLQKFKEPLLKLKY